MSNVNIDINNIKNPINGHQIKNPVSHTKVNSVVSKQIHFGKNNNTKNPLSK